jgi:hypothetical protein
MRLFNETKSLILYVDGGSSPTCNTCDTPNLAFANLKLTVEETKKSGLKKEGKGLHWLVGKANDKCSDSHGPTNFAAHCH